MKNDTLYTILAIGNAYIIHARTAIQVQIKILYLFVTGYTTQQSIRPV